jgi:predicted CoA-binding protein
MNKLSKGFFKDNEILFVGYSSRNKQYSNMVYQALTDNGFQVYPFNTKENASYDIKVYKKLEELPVMPKTAFILLSKDNTPKAVKMLAGKGIKRILFRNASFVDEETLKECEKQGIEMAAGCPMMVYGKGLHKFHALFAGVR